MIKKITSILIASSILTISACSVSDIVSGIKQIREELTGTPDKISTKSVADEKFKKEKKGDFRGCWESVTSINGEETKETNVFFQVSDSKFKFLTKGNKFVQDMTIKGDGVSGNASFVGKDRDGNDVAFNASYKFSDGKSFEFTDWTNSNTNDAIEGLKVTLSRCGLPDISGCWTNKSGDEVNFKLLTDGVFEQKDKTVTARYTLVPDGGFLEAKEGDSGQEVGIGFSFKSNGPDEFTFSNPINLATLEPIPNAPDAVFKRCEASDESSSSEDSESSDSDSDDS